ncbi:hypothetical protein N5C12_09885 [Comamonas aquatica]|uniref:hypothetical protein n=1 Tax=Comamonas aquatica TaxID=225991 RepID=UPI00244A19DD|nr:hypothetical protein [Comamonas aquatica]MDH0899660.1 hypothetical protein [Comamonas aquatica]
MSMTSYAKEKRLQALAKRAGVRLAEALTEGNKPKAQHFKARMYRLLNVVASLRVQEVARA